MTNKIQIKLVMQSNIEYRNSNCTKYAKGNSREYTDSNSTQIATNIVLSMMSSRTEIITYRVLEEDPLTPSVFMSSKRLLTSGK